MTIPQSPFTIKKIDDYIAKKITYETTVPTSEVIARLDKELSKANAGSGHVLELLDTVQERDELERGLSDINDGNDFVLFAQLPFQGWRKALRGTATEPQLVQYIFGNPLIAETMLTYEPHTALHVPPRLLVVEKDNGSGTQVVYLQPSSVIARSVDGELNAQLKAAAEILDEKVERLVRKVTDQI